MASTQRAQAIQGAFLLEIFAGSAGIAKKMTCHGFTALAWDITGPQHDITIASNVGLIIGWITSGWILGIHLGTPCNSFSRARDHGPGPP